MGFEMQYLSVSIKLFCKLLNKTINNDTREIVYETPGKLTEFLGPNSGFGKTNIWGN